MSGLLKIGQQLAPLNRTLDAAQAGIDNAANVSALASLGAPAAGWASQKIAPRVATGLSAMGTAASKLSVPLTAASMGADYVRGVFDPQGARDRLDEATQGTSLGGKMLGLMYGGLSPSSIGATINEFVGLVRANKDVDAASQGMDWTRAEIAKPGLPRRYAAEVAGSNMRRSTMDDAISPFNPLRITEDRLGQAPGSLMQPPAPAAVTPSPAPLTTGEQAGQWVTNTAMPWLGANKGKVLAGAGGLALLTYLLAKRRKKNDEKELAKSGY